MVLFFKSLPRLYKNAFRDLHRHFSMAFSCAVSICVSLLIALLLVVSATNVSQFTKNIEGEIAIQVSLSPTVSLTQREEIQSTLQTIEGIDSVVFSDKQQELDHLIQENGDVFRQYEGDKNPLYDVFVLEMNNPENIEKVSKKIQKIEGVVGVEYGGNTISNLVNVFKGVRYTSAAVVAFMIVVSLFLIRSSMKAAIRMRSEEIAIMRQVGAYNWFISTPFMIEGMTIGFWGALGPSLLVGIGYPLLYNGMGGVFLSEMFHLVNPFPFVLWLVLAIFVAGIFVGMLGSYLAVRKYLRWTR